MARLLYFLAAYTAALLWAAPKLSYWLDEVLTLVGATQPDLPAMMENLRKQQGATPLAFLVPRWFVQWFGFSPLAARLPSILASLASLPALYLIASRLGMRFPLLPVAVFALWPLQFRYALEVRPYALALCLSLWLTWVFLRHGPLWLYVLLTLAMGLSHPYSLVIPGAHLAWSYFFDRPRLRAPIVALALTGLAIAPWYAHFSAGWRAISGEQKLGSTNPRAVLVFLREITGSGYIGAGILFAGLGLSLRRTLPPQHLWTATAGLAIAAVPLFNIVFDYFFAIRQLIYILPALALLLSWSAENSRAGKLLTAAFAVASLYSCVVWLQRPREDWAAAAEAASLRARSGACVEFVGTTDSLFQLFQPGLANRACSGASAEAVVVSSPYEARAEDERVRRRVLELGYRPQSEQSFNGPGLWVYTR